MGVETMNTNLLTAPPSPPAQLSPSKGEDAKRNFLLQNIVHFGRVLRHAGMPIGPDRILQAVAAIEAVGLNHRSDVHAALSAVLLDKHEQQTLFDAAFATFWRDPKLLEQMMYALLPKISGRGEKHQPPRANRLQEALQAPRAPELPKPTPQTAQEELQFEASFTFSDRERLQNADFESMTTAEFEQAKKLAERMEMPIAPVMRRRHAPSARGSIDLRATMLHSARSPLSLQAAYSQPRFELPPLVVLMDISGSMDRYSRLFLHYVHGLTRRHPNVHTLTFGTRLTHITRCLKNRDPDVALAQADSQVHDWKGGTRIASSLEAFNKDWARRMLGGNAAVLLLTDGLDRDENGQLSEAAARLSRMAHQLVWLNPLLRFDGFAPKAAGVRALLPHVDRMLPVHNLASLADLAKALRQPTKSNSSFRSH